MRWVILAIGSFAMGRSYDKGNFFPFIIALICLCSLNVLLGIEMRKK
jgi:hypothetical protein